VKIGQVIKNKSCSLTVNVVIWTTEEVLMKKKDEPMKSFKIRLPAKLLSDLEELATRDNRSIANFVRTLLEGFVKAMRAKVSE